MKSEGKGRPCPGELKQYDVDYVVFAGVVRVVGIISNDAEEHSNRIHGEESNMKLMHR
jgi:hypothetical protein